MSEVMQSITQLSPCVGRAGPTVPQPPNITQNDDATAPNKTQKGTLKTADYRHA